uniref:response regulator n=1 Tax=uncultured Caulobacter sp. TaxID=158749 RepID=UPI0025F37A4C|nr:response regulator [uncultured Caulobacter sp.]
MSKSVPLIYVADDDEPTLELIEAFLARDGLDVVGFPDAARLIAAIAGRKPDAILLDVRIPGLSGLDALKTLKESDAAAIPVLMLTGDGRFDRIVQAMQLGAKGYVMKPFDGPKLVGEVRAMLK